MSRLTTRNLIISIVFLALTLGVFGYGVYFINAANQQLVDQITTLEKNRAQESTMRQLQRIAEESESDRVTLDERFLASEGESIEFLNLVETLARDAGLQIETENLQTTDGDDANSTVLTASFTFTGAYQTVTGFIEVLENLPYLATISTVSLTNENQSQWEASVTMRINIQDYEN
jgi:Tfp pilus assembly protein PilO